MIRSPARLREQNARGETPEIGVTVASHLAATPVEIDSPGGVVLMRVRTRPNDYTPHNRVTDILSARSCDFGQVEERVGRSVIRSGVMRLSTSGEDLIGQWSLMFADIDFVDSSRF